MPISLDLCLLLASELAVLMRLLVEQKRLIDHTKLINDFV